jgi:hypothetical protein
MNILDVGHRRKVNHRMAAGHREAQRLDVEQAPEERLNLAGRVMGRADQVEHPRRHAVLAQTVNDVRADEA